MNDDGAAGTQDVTGFFEGTYLEFLGFRLAVWKEGFTRLEMTVRPEHRNTVGYLHGGVTASLLDIAGAFAGSYGRSGDYVAVTVNMSTSYIAPMKGTTAVVEGELIRRSRSLFFAQARLTDAESSRLCAAATGIYKPRRREDAGQDAARA